MIDIFVVGPHHWRARGPPTSLLSQGASRPRPPFCIFLNMSLVGHDACSMITVHICCPTRLIFGTIQVEGLGERAKLYGKAEGLTVEITSTLFPLVQKSYLWRCSSRIRCLCYSLAGWDMVQRFKLNLRSSAGIHVQFQLTRGSSTS